VNKYCHWYREGNQWNKWLFHYNCIDDRSVVWKVGYKWHTRYIEISGER
jgi:hypothetical protein